MKQEVKNSIIIVIVVLLIIVAVYFGIALFLTGEVGTSKKSNESYSSTGLSLNYENVIIAGKTFSQSEESYMVIFFSEKKSKESLKNTLSLYDNSNKELKLYKVNTDEAINNFVKSDEGNPNATTSGELRIKQDTLITINNGTIISYIEDETQILDNLK